MNRARWIVPTVCFVTLSLPLAIAVIGADSAPDETAPRVAAAAILERHCIECHGGRATRSGLDLTTREGLLKGGEGGAVFDAESAAKSRLLALVRHSEKPEMPFRRPRLSVKEISTLESWLSSGAVYDRKLVTRPQAADDVWWSLRPLRNDPPPIPSTDEDRKWGRTPIDQFIVARLREQGLAPSPEADPRTLLRRVKFDLVGLPPTPEETAEFLSDQSSDAYEKLVDRLLGSKLYGERWARHWMDTVHYAETHGHDQDRPRPNAWPYRDYLINSFNDDKPYARFVEEQLAGDVLFPDDPQALTAMGFLATGPWDESSLRDIRDDSIDREIARYLDRDDIVTTAASTLISTTVHCARCHEHKFDPVSQAEYYQLQAVFSGVDKAERAFDPDPEVARTRRSLTARLAELPVLAAAGDPSLLTAEWINRVADWERRLKEVISPWEILTPETFTSSGEATLTVQGDGSVLAGGKQPEKDVFTITLATTKKSLTGLRLELLVDDSLPMKGPGRQGNGNLHLNELQVAVAPHSSDAPAFVPVKLLNPRADFNQAGWSIDMALDGNLATGWGIYPEVGKSHLAVFEFASPIRFEEGIALQVKLEHVQGGGLGRVRLSVTDAMLPLPLQAEVLPREITDILRTPRDGRAAPQEATLVAFLLRQDLERELATLPPLQKVYSATNKFEPDGSFKPTAMARPVNLLKRGDINKPGDLATPGALSFIDGLDGRFELPESASEGARRVAFARWVTDHRNVIAWRSIVNRVWHYHFGRGIVDTPNDFGRMGGTPTHSELLDWLTRQFQESGGSFKQLHRLIVTSAVFRQSSQSRPEFVERDGDNKYLWRMNRTRLDAESIRDAVLQVSGKLDLTMGGPSVKQFLQSPGIHVTPVVDYLGFDVDRPENYRRSVYRFIFRTLPDPFMETLDCADASQLTPVRSASVTALQALTMLNNKFVVRQSEHIAARLESDARDLPGRIERAYELILCRPATAHEIERVSNYASEHGLANAVRMLLNSNEFMFVN